MKNLLIIGVVLFYAMTVVASEESKTWDATDKAKKFVEETIVIGFFASPYGAGWTEDHHLHNYLDDAREAGITGHSITLAAASYTWANFETEHNKWRSTMAQTPEKYIFVRSVRDIEAAHIRGNTTAVIWNTQSSTILDGDLKKVSTLKEMGIGSMILSYNDLFRAGAGCLAEFNGNNTGVTAWGLAIIDEMVKHGIIVDLSHMGSKTTNGIMDYMDEKYPGVPYVYTHSLPAGLYKNSPEATTRGCYRNISDADALRVVKAGGYVSPTFTEWMMDGIWPEDITPQQCADMIDYYVKLVGVDHVGIASDDMFTTKPTMDFVAKNAAMYSDDGYMVNAFNQGATGCGELSKILPAITDELWKRGYSNEDLRKIYGGNKMRVYREVWEGFSPEDDPVSKEERERFVNEQRQKFIQR